MNTTAPKTTDSTPPPPLAGATGEGEKTTVLPPMSEREREPYLAAIEHGKPRLGDWNYPDMLRRLLACYDAQAAETARLQERNAMLGFALDAEQQSVDDLVKDLKATRARLQEEQEAGAASEREKLQLHEELRGLRADVADMNRQIGEAHRQKREWIDECGKRTEARKAAEKSLNDFQREVAAKLRAQLVDPERCFTDTAKDWAEDNNRQFIRIIESLGLQFAPENDAAALPLQGEEDKEPTP